ncbi:hypothetical protein [Amycolatopsis solani]|uniref:hypothetical protein n=1 Tax=Amycolatopsis solani TaxID=3028615 RepID=UPI0025AFAD36|nr:hypothetical protein [Amycolatopsis sp. MEP2-6]
MTDQPKGKIRKAVTAAAGAVASELVGNALPPGAPPPPPPPQPEPVAAETAHDVPEHEYVPEVETSTVTRGEDGSVAAQTGTVWHPETVDGLPLKDLPTVEEFEQIEVREDEFGNFIIDATERFVVHTNGHDEVYTDHQHIVVPGDGTPGDTDIDIVQDADIVIHENPDGTITVEHQGSLTYELTPDAPGHGDIEIFQEETVLLDEAETGPPGIDVAVTVDEQAKADDPFGEPAGPAIHQTEVIADKGRGATVTAQVTAPAPALPGAPPPAVVTFTRTPSTVDAAPVAVETTTLAASASLAEHPVPRHSFATEREPAHHDAGEVTGSRPHPFEPPRHDAGEVTGSEPPPGEHPFEPPRHDNGTQPSPEEHPFEPPRDHEPGPGPASDHVPGDPPPQRHEPHEDHLAEPEPVPEDHPILDHAHADGGG